MQYTEVSLRFSPLHPLSELLVYALGDEGPYDSFEEQPDGLKAYVPTKDFDGQFLASVVEEQQAMADSSEIQYEVCLMPDVDWNEEWEKQHKPVLVEGGHRIWVRAPFHDHRSDVDYEIEIEPKMSFGTAHHPTTYLMLSYVSDLPVCGCRVLDMGCGTAVLGILAAKCGASSVVGVDVDEWAYQNAMENVVRNGVIVDVRIGDASLLAGLGRFDLVLANINRNILLRDMASYAAVLNLGGTLLLSGFYEHDVPSLVAKAELLGLKMKSQRKRDGWCAVELSLVNKEV